METFPCAHPLFTSASRTSSKSSGLIPHVSAICRKTRRLPEPPYVQKNATFFSRPLCMVRYVRTGADSDAFQTGVPTMTRS